MIWSMPRFQHSFELLPRVLKEVAPLLIPLSAALWGLEFYVAYLHKARFADPYNSSMATIIVVGLLGLVMQCFATVISLLYVARSTQRQMKNGFGEHPMHFLKTHFHQSLIEYLRGFISTALYTLILIIPGIFRWVQLVFVCLISSFDPRYQEGKVDALKESSRLVKGAWVPLFVFLLIQMILPVFFTEGAKGDGSFDLMTIPLYGIAWIIQLYLAIYFSLTFFARHSLKMERA
jgi:hypothetical protein